MRQQQKNWKIRSLFLKASFFIWASLVGFSTASVIQEIKVEGNVRVDTQTLLSHLLIKKGQDATAERLDESLKALFATGLFADVVLEPKWSTLYVKVVENKMLNQIVFEGNDKVKDDVLLAEIGLRPREVYTAARVQEASQKIRDIYRLKGHFSAKVTAKIIERDQNRVDLVFEIDEGPLTSVRRISFVGNHRFSDNRLERVIATKESRWYRFFTTSDTYDPDRLNYDKELLRQYYLENGYADFQVISSVAELSPDQKDFFITFTVDEGACYHFGKIELQSALPQIQPLLKELEEELTFSSGDGFNNKEIEKSIDIFIRLIGNAGFSFVDIKPELKRNPKNHTIDVVFNIFEAPHVYVNKIIIEGNTGTDDTVVRREFRLAEGDPLNQSKLKRSQERIENLDYFSKIDLETEKTPFPDRENVRLKIEEKSTGELMFAGGYSTYDGPLGEIKLRERNFLGRGQEVRGKLGIAKRTQEFLLGFSEPYTWGRRLTTGVDVYTLKTKQDTQKNFSGGYSQKITGTTLSMGYEITEALSQGWTYKIRRENVGGFSAAASPYIKEMAGQSLVSSVGHDLFYDRRDSSVRPTSGYYFAMGNEFAGVGGNVSYFSNVFSTGRYYPVDADHEWILGVRGKYAIEFKVNKPTRLADRYMLGGSSFPGFAESGIGPRDAVTGDALGGQQLLLGVLDLTFPLGLPKEFDIRGVTFTDWGGLWQSGIPAGSNPIASNNWALRGSIGIGVIWRSPFGIIGFSFAKALKRVQYIDRVEVFRINFGTEF